jgi:hypothetical protein
VAFWFVKACSFYVDTNVLEEHTASMEPACSSKRLYTPMRLYGATLNSGIIIFL